jgi:hypothetical protein
MHPGSRDLTFPHSDETGAVEFLIADLQRCALKATTRFCGGAVQPHSILDTASGKSLRSSHGIGSYYIMGHSSLCLR